MTTERQLPARSVLDTQSLVSKESAKLTALREKRSEEHTSELQSHSDLVCRLLLEKKKKKKGRRNGPRAGRPRNCEEHQCKFNRNRVVDGRSRLIVRYDNYTCTRRGAKTQDDVDK